MAVNLSPVGGVAAQFFTNSGAVLTGGKLFTYLAGTTTPATAYTSSQGNVAWTNPIVLDAAGRVSGSGEIWITDGLLYKFLLKDANDVLIATYDNISGINSNFIAFVNQQEIVTATANQTVFNLGISYQPGTNSLSVFVDGVNQYGPGAQYAYTETDSDTVTFTSGLHVGAEVKFTTTQQQSAGAVDAQQVSYDPPFTGSVATNVEAKLAQTVSVTDFGATGDGSDEYAEILAAWNYCLANGKNLYFPAGTYSSGINNMPFKNPTFPATSLLDCKDITIYGDGPNTVLKSDSVSGADVLNLYAVQNLHIRNMKITANLSGFAGAGSNGCSIVGGFDNITIENLWLENLPYVDKTTYLDGGKGLTIQPGSPTMNCGTLVAKNIFAKGCVHGVGFDVDNDNWLSKTPAVRIEAVVEDCYEGILWSGLALTSPGTDNGFTAGLTISATAVNCQHSVSLLRLYGSEIDVTVVNTKSAAQRRLNPNGGAWSVSDAVVDALVAKFVRNSKVTAIGYAADCDYKVQVGGTLDSATNNSTFYINLGGPAATISNFNVVNAGGNIVNNSVFYVTTVTTSSIPTSLYTPSLNNTVTLGSQQKLMDVVVQNAVNFAYTDGITSYTEFARDGFGVFAKQTGASAGNTAVLGTKDHTGVKKFFIRNDGYIATDGRGTASAVATVKGVLPIYDTTNVLVGYAPIYTSYT
jgi:hypothetical protein